MDSCSFCAAVTWKLLGLPWACLPESVRAHCFSVATFCSHCCHTALITSLLCLEHLISATVMCLGWQVPRAVLPHWAGWSSSQKDCDLCMGQGTAETELQPVEKPSTRAGGYPKEAMTPWEVHVGTGSWQNLGPSGQRSPHWSRLVGRIQSSLFLKD